MLAHMIDRGNSPSLEIPSNFDNIKTTELAQYCSTLKRVAQEVAQRADLLAPLGLDVDDKALIFSYRVPDWLNHLSETAKESMEQYLISGPLSETKIAKLRKEMDRGLEHFAPFRIFEKHNRLLKINLAKKLQRGIRSIRYTFKLPREALLDKCLTGYDNPISECATRASVHFQNQIVSALSEECSLIVPSSLSTDSSFNALLLFAGGDLLQQADSDTLDSSEYFATYSLWGSQVPVLHVYNKQLNERALLLSLSRFGFLAVDWKNYQLEIQPDANDNKVLQIGVVLNVGIIRRKLGSAGYLLSYDQLQSLRQESQSE